MVGFADVRSAWWHCYFVTSVGVEDNGTPVLFSPFPIFVSARGPRRNRLCSQMRTSLLPDADVPRPRRERIWDEARLHTVPRSLTSIGKGRGDGRVFKIQKNLRGFCQKKHGEYGTAAPERGSYSRIGARPYLPPVLINSRFCPCKGRISLAGLAPQ